MMILFMISLIDLRLIFLNICILLTYSWLTMFQVHKVVQLYKYTYIIFEIIFHHVLLQDIDYSSLCYIQ